MLPTKQEIVAEATRLYFQRNREVGYNTPEEYELREEGLLREAQIRLMRTTVHEDELPHEDRIIAQSVNYITEVKDMEKQDWVQEWMKTDPYMIDIEGFEKFMKEKEKELRVQVSVSLCSDMRGTRDFQIWIEVPSNQIPEEMKNEKEVAQKERQVQTVAMQIEDLLKQLGRTDHGESGDESSEGLRHGSVHVFLQPPLTCRPDICIQAVHSRNEDEEQEPVWWKIVKEEWNNCEWVYSGDESHCGEENIAHNAKILWQIWNAIGKLVPTCFGIGKDYQCNNIYLYCYEDTLFPPFSTMEASVVRLLKDSNDYEDALRFLKIETTELDETGLQLNELGKTLLSIDIPNTEDIERNDFIWILGEQPLPMLSRIGSNVPEVLSYLSTGEEWWDPENDDNVWRNGGMEMIHPFLRRELKLKWNEEDVIWDEAAEEFRTLFYTRFTDQELAQKTVEELSKIANAKGIRGHARKQDLIDEILKANDITMVKPTAEVLDA